MAHRNSSLLRRRSIHILPPSRQLERHLLQSLCPSVLVRRVIIRLVVIGFICISLSGPLLHRIDMRGRIHLRLIIKPSRHVTNSHVISVGIAITRLAEDGACTRRERYFGGRPSTKELSVQVYTFAVDLLDIFTGIRRVAGVKVPANAELVAYIKLDPLVSESVVDSFRYISLQSGYITILHPRDSRFSKDTVKTEVSMCISNKTYDLGNVVVTSIRLLAERTTSGPPIACRAAMRG